MFTLCQIKQLSKDFNLLFYPTNTLDRISLNSTHPFICKDPFISVCICIFDLDESTNLYNLVDFATFCEEDLIGFQPNKICSYKYLLSYLNHFFNILDICLFLQNKETKLSSISEDFKC